ncbi:hypothetical protein BS47DRAFT_1367127 [Hydnum rufescens UP504]|uniref:Uncharacterized protein n=1 Tax=Hydnum rufescens UP504 TaxID=1448309 RepID=A0A9P6DQL8_9AGAM|nr:hypothetical protein BS47DRAFT_1367127 [Hydnum rufescens UP504]
MVPHTRQGGCVALLGPFSLRETLPEECTDRTLGEIWWRAQPLKTPTVCGNIRYIHCTISNPIDAQAGSRMRHGTAQPPIPPNPRFSAMYTRTKQIWHHTPAEAGVWQYQGVPQCQKSSPAALLVLLLLSPSVKPNLNNAQTTPTMKYGSAQPPKTQTPLTIRKKHDDASNMVPHTRRSGCVAISYQAQGKTQQHAATQTLTLDYPHLTKQIQCHTPASVAPLSLHEPPSDEWPEKAYSEIWSMQPIRPQPLSLENYNTMTNQICHTPALAGTFPP